VVPFPSDVACNRAAVDTPHIVGLARVSTHAQDTQLQLDALRDAGCTQIFEEHVSTRSTARPGLEAALANLQSGDTLAVWKLDRLGRSVKDVLIIADDLHSRGVELRILTGTLAGTYKPTGEGKFFFTMIAAFAELERDIIRERTLAGIAAARARGSVFGRPRVITPEMAAEARDRRARGETLLSIAKALGVSRTSVSRYVDDGAATRPATSP